MVKVFTKEPVRKGKMYYFVEYCNSPQAGRVFAICDTHQKAYGLVRKDTHENAWINPEWNPLQVKKGYYI